MTPTRSVVAKAGLIPLTGLVRARLATATRGPWKWIVNLKARTVHLEGNPRRGLEYVMDFVRWGMGGARCRFRVDPAMRNADDFASVAPGREHHEDWYQHVDHPDAILIEQAPTDLENLCDGLDLAVAALREAKTHLAHFGHNTIGLDSVLAELESPVDRLFNRQYVPGELWERLLGFYTEDEAWQWLTAPHKLLRGNVPLDFLKASRAGEVLALIEQLETGAHV